MTRPDDAIRRAQGWLTRTALAEWAQAVGEPSESA